jgi:hypothetical protein
MEDVNITKLSQAQSTFLAWLMQALYMSDNKENEIAIDPQFNYLY